MPEMTRGTILIIEDDTTVALLERRSLERAGYAVSTAVKADEGMERILQGAVDLIVLDYILPGGVTGLDFYTKIKTAGFDLPVIVVTALNDEATIIKALRAGVRDFVSKSKQYLEYLPEAVDRVLAQDRATRELARSEEELKHAASLLLSTLEATADGLLVIDRLKTITSFNNRFAEMWEIPQEVLETRDAEKAIAFISESLKNPEEFVEKARELHRQPLAQSCDLLELKDGRILERYSQPQMLEGKPVGRVWSFRNITQRKKAEDRLVYLAHHDALTGLPNRALLHDRLNQALAQAQRSDRRLALLFLDLDRFKAINDSLGHVFGDQLLKAVAERLTDCVRESDTIARVGGDEFTIILTNINQALDAGRVAQKILDALSQPFLLGPELFITASIGVTFYPSDGLDASSLFKNADAAMYRAKEQGKNNYQFYTAEMNIAALDHLAMENNLRHGLEQEEFTLHYQPQVDLNTGRIIGVEALCRWKSAKLGWVSPGQFIPIAEETGLIVPIGERVLRAACAQAQTWREVGLPPIRTVVNLSGRQFKQKNLIKMILQTLKETGLEPEFLGFELTESVIMQNAETTIGALQELNGMGIHISVDDFGTGYSSLSYLNRFPIHTLKIDQSFVQNITTTPTDAAIATSIITLAHSLKLNVIAEGVETKEQLTLLRGRGCDAMQGYYFSKPLPAETLTRLLQEGRSLELNG